MPQSPSIVSDKLDRCIEKPTKHMAWHSIKEFMMPYTHNRPLPKRSAKRALDYIAAITKSYPFQLRYSMALPLWYRFCQAWCETGEEGVALNAI